MKHAYAILLKNSIALCLYAALSISLTEWALSSALAEINYRTYVFYMLLHSASALLVGMALAILLRMADGKLKKYTSWDLGAPAFLPAVVVAVYLFIYGFYYINEKLTPAVGMFAPLSIFADLLFMAFAAVAFRLALKSERAGSGRLAIFLSSGFLPLVALVGINLRFFAWQPPVMRTGELFAGVFAFGGAVVGGSLVAHLISKNLPGAGKAWIASVLNLLLGAAMIAFLARSGSPSASGFAVGDSQGNKVTTAPRPRNIIWIVTDTARRDHLSMYGSSRNATPQLEAFSKEALVFDRAISAAPWTAPSHASMFTGMFPSKHGAHFKGDAMFCTPLGPENVTLAEILSAKGYQTAAIVANNAGLSRSLGCDQGFQYYFDAQPFVFSLFWGKVLQQFSEDFRVDRLWVNEACLSSEINHVVRDWLGTRDTTRPFFLFINYMEPHGGIAFLPGKYDSLYGYARSKSDEIFKNFNADDIVHFKGEVTKAERAFWTAFTQRKIAFMDMNLGKLFQRLKDMGLFNDAMIVVNSDHGELFGEHQTFGHNTDLYNELIWVPMLVRYPEARRRGRSERLVQTVDIMPEILKSVGLDVPADVQGQPFDAATHDVIAEIFMQEHNSHARRFPERYNRDLKAIFSGVGSDSLKYIWSSNDKSELFDLGSDPNESNNIIAERPSQADSLNRRLQRWQNSFVPVEVTDKRTQQDKEELEKRLRSLGYIK